MFCHGNEGKGERVSSAALLGPGSPPPPALRVHLPAARSASRPRTPGLPPPPAGPWENPPRFAPRAVPAPRSPALPAAGPYLARRAGAAAHRLAPRPGSPPAPPSLPGPGRLHPAALSAPFAREVPQTGRILRHGAGQRHAAWGASSAAAPAAPSHGTVGVPAGLRGPGHRPRVAAAARCPQPRGDGPQQREPRGKGGPGDKGAGSPGRAASGAGASPEPAPLSAAGTAPRPAAGSPACLRRALIYLLRLPTQRASAGGIRGSAPPAPACVCLPACLARARPCRHRPQRWGRGNGSGCRAGQSQTRGPGSAAGGAAVLAPSSHAELHPAPLPRMPTRSRSALLFPACSGPARRPACCGHGAGAAPARMQPTCGPSSCPASPGMSRAPPARLPVELPDSLEPPPRLCVRSGSAHHAHLQPCRAVLMHAQMLPAQLLCWRPQACIPRNGASSGPQPRPRGMGWRQRAGPLCFAAPGWQQGEAPLGTSPHPAAREARSPPAAPLPCRHRPRMPQDAEHRPRVGHPRHRTEPEHRTPLRGPGWGGSALHAGCRKEGVLVQGCVTAS